MKPFIFLTTVAVLLTLSVKPMWAQNYQVIFNFTGANGEYPSNLTADASGNLYGVTQAGGSSNGGTVFKLSRSGSGWTLTTLYDFKGGNDGYDPMARVVFGPGGVLYGTTFFGGGGPCNLNGLGIGCGTVFKLQPPVTPCHSQPCEWNETVLYRFQGSSDGAYPYDEPIFDQSGNVYGTTVAGGQENGTCLSGSEDVGCGTVYELTPSNGGWKESQLYTFAGTPDGFWPYSALAFDKDGNLYGTTRSGGSDNQGTVFELSPSGGSWTENEIYQFTGMSDGSQPYSAVVFDKGGNLYGANTSDAFGPGGVVFQLTPSGGTWTELTLYTFNSNFGVNFGPFANITLDSSLNIYGATYGSGLGCMMEGCGTVFELARSGAGWSDVLLYDFPGGNNGEFPQSNAALDAKGNLYGTTTTGGTDNEGVVFETQAAGTLFSDLGPIGNTYNCCVGWTVAGSGAFGESVTAANLFTIPGNGNFNIAQIDLGVSLSSGTNAFYASIWTDNGGLPGTQVANAYWGNLRGAVSCCTMITIPVSGVTLTGGQSYFMIVGPMNLSGDTFEVWNWNNQGIDGLDLYSTDGGNTWINDGSGQPLGAFDVIGLSE